MGIENFANIKFCNAKWKIIWKTLV